MSSSVQKKTFDILLYASKFKECFSFFLFLIRSSGGGAFNGSPNSPRMAYNEDELFCLSVAQTLRRLPLMRRSMAKVQILQLIHDTEFGHS